MGPDPLDSVNVGAIEAEAVKFLEDPELGPDRSERVAQVREQIQRTGTYRHTEAELAYGAQLAWRNNARCIGRLHWPALEVLDRRDCTTAEEIAQACIDHIAHSTNGGNLRSSITVFAPAEPDGRGIRIWNSQLIRYAGYRQPDGSVVGDPLNIELTEAIQALNWRGKGGMFDILPLVVQPPCSPPQLFEVPPEVVTEVEIRHPEYEWFEELELRWHALPAISNMSLELGGLSYPAAPFSGWYVSTEIAARNFSDEQRYNLLPVIAGRMGLDIATTRSLWKDRALIELNQAVLYSFQTAKVRMVDHHLATRQFLNHEERERKAGRQTPMDWAWIVPPISGSTAATFHRDYEPPDFAIRPNFCYQDDPWSPESR